MMQRLFHKCQAVKNGGGIDIWIDRNGERFFIHLITQTIQELESLKVQGDSMNVMVEFEEPYDPTKPIEETPDDIRREMLSREFDELHEKQEREKIIPYLDHRIGAVKGLS